MNLREFAIRLEEGEPLAVALGTASPFIEVVVVSGIKQGINDSTSPDGTPYKPLGFPRASGGNKPLRDKGLLAASVSASMTGTEISMRANSPGARLHQFGGKIVPKTAKALTIPKSPEAKRAGSARNFPRPLFVLGSTLAERVGKGKSAKIVVHYIFVMSVTVPARPYLGINTKTMGQINTILSREYSKAVLKDLTG
jgi:phage gpG-like protein